ncbi:uncharacterized protein LOC119771184 isoform X2 [Culex quinquefasciatus]|uniref:uncharacterized protein LOC119771184 isoform X2 n=1 Tax=Culex quinquefasciatus TaxID=7176 RepID=UPI0018E3848A|nr:uncharacterized protein LOC119771184 isoform X2 [Culex quinquefasciatus]
MLLPDCCLSSAQPSSLTVLSAVVAQSAQLNRPVFDWQRFEQERLSPPSSRSLGARVFSVTIASSAGQLNVTLSGELRVFNGCDSFVTFGVAGKVAFVSVRGRCRVSLAELEL